MKKILIGGLIATTPILSFADATTSTLDDVKLSGYVRAVSAYVSKGGTNSPENDSATLQGSLTAKYNNAYVSWWGSKLGYSWKENNTSSANSYEHDFIVGYSNTYNDFNYDVYLNTIYYPGGKNTTGMALNAIVSHELSPALKNSASVSVETYLNNVTYMNQGDTYVGFGYSQPLPQDFKLDLETGWNFYRSGAGKYNAGINKLDEKSKDIVWRYGSIQLSHSVINKDITAWVKYVIGGQNRFGEDQKNMAVMGAQFNF